ncbi:hypothetical protein CFN78_12730 [Amycolatopsis antarctica]|uniref:Uncharacterized protein n=1 Tax=Amycolatopsis antarctica TaxID=1854586 RepID=A0A263D6N3_9PSEU|nr:hypothetical protein [Amycolatopsis antarctica]OZM73075.1 hypothetical protein CFN78_12730 [Amycolatopsis antarctica]
MDAGRQGADRDRPPGLLQEQLCELSPVHRRQVVDGATHDGPVMRREHAAEVDGIEWVRAHSAEPAPTTGI